MTYRKKMLVASIVACLCIPSSLWAQDAAATKSPATKSPATAADKTKAKDLGTVTVVGIRDSEAESLQTKQDADSHIEVVTAEDIGKLPAKNVADTLQRLPGVNISSASASEGGFDESDRVSLRGANPSMTQTLVNGHTIGTGDWFVLNQVASVGRSVSYSLLPSEIVSQVIVRKTSEAKTVEGGSAGSVDIITRKPLEFAKKITAEASVGGVYSDLPSSTKPQFSGMFNWKSDDKTLGVMLQGFYEQRSLQRNGQEVVGGYSQIAADAPVVKTHPDLAGVYYPNLLGATLFTQKRTRKGGVVDIEFKPTDNLTLNLNGFYSKLKADNYNRNYMLWASQFAPYIAPSSYSVKNGVLSNASYASQAGSSALCGTALCSATPFGVYDQISRPGASSKSDYLTLDADWHVTDRLSLKGQVGTTEGVGSSPTQDVIELGTAAGGGANWEQRGIGRPANWNLGGDNSSSAGILPASGWIFGDQDIKVKDKEHWLQGDGALAIDSGVFSTLEFGARYSDHTRDNKTDIGQGPDFTSDWQNANAYPDPLGNYPADFGGELGGSTPGRIWYYTPSQLAAIDSQFANRDAVTRFNWQNIYKVNEKIKAAYLQADFAGQQWSGNLGLRYVRTEENINYNTGSQGDNSVGDAITGSAFGSYYRNKYNHTYNKLLPSANYKYNFTDELVGRLAASKTMTRPDYSALAGSVSLDDLTHTGSGGNPELKPIISTNFDASLEWYFEPRGLLSAGVYRMNLKDYVNFGPEARTYKDQNASNNTGQDVFNTYLVSVPVNVDGHIKGAELNYIQPIGAYFGVSTNFTYAEGEANNGAPLQGTSKKTFNVSGYFENDKFNARLSYTYRSEFYAGVSRTDTYFQSGVGNLAASLGYQINSWMSLSLDAMNLNNPKLKYYTKNDAYGKQPYAFYVNGRQYYLNLRFKF